MGSRYEHVFEPIRIRGVDFRNRLELAPPSPNLADGKEESRQSSSIFFRSFARGGVAVLHVGNSVVDFREARDEERQLDLGTDDCILPLTRFVEMCAGYGALASLEINHNGKDSHSDKTGRPAYSSSSFIPTMEKFRAPALRQGADAHHRDGPREDPGDRREVRHGRLPLQDGRASR